MDVPRLTHVRVNVRDLTKAIEWYERLLGVPAAGHWPPDAPTYAHFDLGPAQFALGQYQPVPAGGARFNLEVDDVDAWWARVGADADADADVIEPLADTPYGSRKFTIRDPDGNELGFVRSDLLSLLTEATRRRDADAVEAAIALIFQLDLLGARYVDVLCDLVVADWHERHEDVARALQLLSDPSAVPALHRAAELNLPYREYDEGRALSRKCMWALSDIRTDQAVAALESLSRSPDAVIRDLALHHLAKIRDGRPPSPGSQRFRNR